MLIFVMFIYDNQSVMILQKYNRCEFYALHNFMSNKNLALRLLFVYQS